MNGYDFSLSGARLTARASGTLWWAAEGLLCLSDMHLGKAERMARRGGAALPPYEIRDTLTRLEAEIEALSPATVLCLGDSFDDLAAADALSQAELDWLARLQAGRRWIWLEGNHDPGPIALGGTHLGELALGPLTFRHIAEPGAQGEISGHYHPKAGLRGAARPCFLLDDSRLILPAFGTYTGGLRSRDPVLAGLMQANARAILTGRRTQVLPMPR
ncbi:ligase-associated DNA damage response endonuclease PdeM [Pseudooceanicola sp. HF7]|uniref:ligase-associated DNA damage response endonuclease PdeM n=1 Tax=Pseudooceanicola sp. HF7 TaxID=2721560 RepID=UPI001430075A|nr:ligase-associated DNA damage response endonuclease PdeM [Pseudooceanicola sp. HF7]NIZ08956.1 ligase-associated DNA damage response endonuclease PdeM [Pseudooceanicola sp. HF7]